jgi:hypothetical protein
VNLVDDVCDGPDDLSRGFTRLVVRLRVSAPTEPCSWLPKLLVIPNHESGGSPGPAVISVAAGLLSFYSANSRSGTTSTAWRVVVGIDHSPLVNRGSPRDHRTGRPLRLRALARC